MGAAENRCTHRPSAQQTVLPFCFLLPIYCFAVTCALNPNSDAGGMWHRAQARRVIRSVPSESLHGFRSHSSCCWIFLHWSIGELEYHNDENDVLRIRRGGVHQS
jgi:hypothetical protein